MKKIMITGASAGIGLEIAKSLAKDNQLTLVARNKESLERLTKELPGKGHQFIASDLSRKDDTHALADHLAKNHYDVLINNAGVGLYGKFEVIPLNDQMNMVHLNIYGLTVLSHSYLKNAKNGDSLVNVASTLGTTSFPSMAVYAATKAYVVNFSESLWWENRHRGVYVLGFCPGVTQTRFHEASGGEAPTDMYPGFIIQKSTDVVKELLNALEKRKKPKVVSGTMNRFMLFFHRFLSRKTIVNMMGGFSPLKDVAKQISTGSFAHVTTP